MDILVIKLKRPREKVTLDTFNTITRDLLNNHISKSNNLDSITLFRAIGIRHYIIFYNKELLRGQL